MMKEINCTIIQDLLPLYVDGVVSPDTQELVEEHLEHCEECKKEVKFMKKDLSLPIEKKVPLFKDLKKKWRNKKLMISGASILLTSLILFGAFYYVYHFDSVVPYSESLVQIETQDNGALIAHYYGKDYYSVAATDPVSVEIDGQQKRIIFLHYTETIAESHSKKLFQDDETQDEGDVIFPLNQETEVDAIYYADFDVREIIENGNQWESVLENADLMWEMPNFLSLKLR